MGFPLVLGSGFLLCAPAWYAAWRRETWRDWDTMSLLVPLPLWLALSILHIGSQNPANLIAEPILVAIFVPIALSVRIFWLDRFSRDIERSSQLTFVACVFPPLCLRLIMPFMP